MGKTKNVSINHTERIKIWYQRGKEIGVSFEIQAPSNVPEIPEDYLCTICQCIMTDPQLGDDQRSYQSDEIKIYLNKKNEVNNTGNNLKNNAPVSADKQKPVINNYFANTPLKKIITQFLIANPVFWETQDVYFSQTVAKQLVETVKTNNRADMSRILEKDPQDPRLLTAKLADDKDLLAWIVEEGGIEQLSYVLKKLDKKIWTLPSLIADAGFTIFRKAIQRFGLEGAKILAAQFKWDKQDYQWLFEQSLLEGHVDLLPISISLGADPNKMNAQGSTPLHHLVNTDNQEALSCLLKQDQLKISLLDVAGETALHCAVRLGKLDSVKLFTQTKLSLDLSDMHGFTPLQLAVTCQELAIVDCLIEAKADTTIRWLNNHTILMYGITQKLDKFIAHWLNKHVSYLQLDAHDDEGNTALHLAVTMKNVDLAKALVEKGAKIKYKSTPGSKSAIDLARDLKLSDLVAWLKAEHLRKRAEPFVTPLKVTLAEQSQKFNDLAAELTKKENEISQHLEKIVQQSDQIARQAQQNQFDRKALQILLQDRFFKPLKPEKKNKLKIFKELDHAAVKFLRVIDNRYLISISSTVVKKWDMQDYKCIDTWEKEPNPDGFLLMPRNDLLVEVLINKNRNQIKIWNVNNKKLLHNIELYARRNEHNDINHNSAFDKINKICCSANKLVIGGQMEILGNFRAEHERWRYHGYDMEKFGVLRGQLLVLDLNTGKHELLHKYFSLNDWGSDRVFTELSISEEILSAIYIRAGNDGKPDSTSNYYKLNWNFAKNTKEDNKPILTNYIPSAEKDDSQLVFQKQLLISAGVNKIEIRVRESWLQLQHLKKEAEKVGLESKILTI